MIFCSGPISHPYPQLGKTAGRNPEMRAEQGRQHSAAWVASTTQGPGPRDWQSTLRVGVSNLCVCASSGASRPSSVVHRSRIPEAHARCVPHTPHPRSCYQFCSLSSCTNNDTSAAQVSSSISKRLLDTVSMNSGGWGAPHPAAQRSSALGDPSWCCWAISQHTVDPVGWLG